MDTMDKTEDTDITKDTEQETAETVSRQDLEVFNDYLIEVATALLGLDSHDYFNKVIQSEENYNKVMAFVTDKQYRSLLVTKTEEFSKGQEDKDEAKEVTGQDDGEEDISTTSPDKSKSIVNIEIDLKVHYRGGDAQTVAFIKRQHILTVDLKSGKKSMGKQIQVMNLGYPGEETEVFRMANIYLDNGLIPLFVSYKHKKGQDDAVYGHIDEIEQLLAKLRMEFIHCSQDQMSYEVKLIVNQKVLTKKQKAEEEGRQITEDDFEEEMKDPAFQEALMNNLKSWTKDIQKITYMKTDIPIDSVLTENTFWENRERALQSIQDQLNTAEVQMVLNLLKKMPGLGMKVFSFEQDINVTPEMKKAQEFTLQLKDSPIGELMSATDLKSVTEATKKMFTHFKTLSSTTLYQQGRRLFKMIEAYSRDVSKRVLKILEDVNLMFIESRQFDAIKEDAMNIFKEFDSKHRDLTEAVNRRVTGRVRQRQINKPLDLEHPEIEARLKEISNQRTENDKLLEIISSVQDEDEAKNKAAIKDIKDAYTVFVSINVLDISMDGTKKWNKAKKEYNLKIDRIEEEITSQMRDRLASAKTTNDMFRTFSRFNALFSRPRIRDAIQEYQNQILSSIKKDIKNFREKMSVKYNTSEVSKVYKYRNFPSLSGYLMWAQQLTRKLQMYQQRIHDVLGAGWERHVAGKQLQSSIEPLAKYLDDMQATEYDRWHKEMHDLKLFTGQHKFIFKVDTKSDGTKKLEVSFDEKALDLYREKVPLRHLNKSIAYSLMLKAGEVEQCYPNYLSLVDSLATFYQVSSQITPDIAILLAAKRNRLHTHIENGKGILWKEDRDLEPFCRQIEAQVQDLEESTHLAKEKSTK